jgi:hypothetical protein
MALLWWAFFYYRQFELISTKTGTTPLFTKAIAVDTNVNEGIIISSPSFRFNKVAIISKPPVAECVKNKSESVYILDKIERHSVEKCFFLN